MKKLSDAGGSLSEAFNFLRMQRRKEYKAGDKAFVLSAKYGDGTRLRDDPSKKDQFSRHFFQNGQQVEIVDVRQVGSLAYARVRQLEPAADLPAAEGWILQRNLTRVKGTRGKQGVQRTFRIHPEETTAPAQTRQELPPDSRATPVLEYLTTDNECELETTVEAAAVTT